MKRLIYAGALSVLCFSSVAGAAPKAPAPRRNVVIFVADGLRYDSVNDYNAPTFMKIRREGVDFTNSHSVYPTLTTVNAAVIATGHQPGDTGDYGNVMYVGFPAKCLNDTTTPYVEDDCMLRELKKKHPGYMAQTTLMGAARKAGMSAVMVGKLGPVGIQYLPALDSKNAFVSGVNGVLIDDFTNKWATSPKLNEPLASEIQSATGMNAPAYTTAPNLTQQAYELSATSQVLIPHLAADGKPFAMLFWSRDPDITQHHATDSAGRLSPGINSTNDYQAIHNADDDLKGIIDALKLNHLYKNTDIIVIADHGFSTIAKGVPDAAGNYSTTMQNGFLARDIAGWLGEKVYDPDNGYVEIDLSAGEHPGDNSYIGKSAEHPDVITVSNGNTEFIHVPAGPKQFALTKELVSKLAHTKYVSGIFVNDALMQAHRVDFKGALSMRDINMIGSSDVPQPTIVVSFSSFKVKGCKQAAELLCGAEIADTTLDVGQGDHGAFSRADTRNYMAAIGPDFKTGVKITSPVGNVDVAPTAAYLIGVALSGTGHLKGRVMTEALKGHSDVAFSHRRIASEKADNGEQTVVDVQDVNGHLYLDAGGFPDRTFGLK